MAIAGRAGSPQVPPDRAGISDLWGANGAGRLGERLGASSLDSSPRDARSDPGPIPLVQVGDPAQADDMLRAHMSEIDLDHEIGASGQWDRSVAHFG